MFVVGLGNPGVSYASTRHNAGIWFVRCLAHNSILSYEKKSRGWTTVLSINGLSQTVRLFIPDTYMNTSGEAVAAAMRYYHIPRESLLVAHDDLDFPPGVIRLKKQGGHGGHRGILSILEQLKTNLFLRVRIGIGRPQDTKDVSHYVLHEPPNEECVLIHQAISEWVAFFSQHIHKIQN